MHGFSPTIHRRGNQHISSCVKVPAPHPHPDTYTLLIDLPSVGQGCSDTDPHSHEDSRQTCVQRGRREGEGRALCPKPGAFHQPTALSPHPGHRAA